MTTTTYEVHILGPNLRDQTTGDFHVHAKGCGDVKRSPLYRGQDYAYDRANAVEVRSQRDAVEFVYADQLDESGDPWEFYASDLYWFPCAAHVPAEA